VQLQALSGYDPEGDNQEHDELASAATDGNPATSWTTETYGSQDFGGLKHGVGLLLDAGSSVKLAHVTVKTETTPGFTAESPPGLRRGAPVGRLVDRPVRNRLVRAYGRRDDDVRPEREHRAVLRRLDHTAGAGRPRRDLRSNGDALVLELRPALVAFERELDQ